MNKPPQVSGVSSIQVPTGYRRMPIIFEHGQHGEQAFDIFSWLSKKHSKIFIDGIIDDDMANAVSAQLFSYTYTSQKDVELLINSPGGIVRSLFTMLDAIDLVRGKGLIVKTSCVGQAASCAAILLLYGNKGHRSATRRSSIMMHDLSSGMRGTFKDLQISLEDVKTIRNEIADIITSRSDISMADVEDFMDRDKYMDVHEAISLDIIDRVKEEY